MTVTNIFSKRQKWLSGEVPGAYRYDLIPDALRVQIVQILDEVVSRVDEDPRDVYSGVARLLRKEYGTFRLAASPHADDREDLITFVLQEADVSRVLDAVEVLFGFFQFIAKRRSYVRPQVQESVSELNIRFSEHGVGYQFENGRIIRRDSEYVHAEVVKPALQILAGKNYPGAQEEFLKAHAHLRKGDTKGALNESLKALESVMKSICYKRGWSVEDGATAGKLIGVCFERELVPSFWQGHFSGLRSLLESGVPPARNRLGGHGQGPTRMTVPTHIAAYALHMTAAAVVFLAEADAALP